MSIHALAFDLFGWAVLIENLKWFKLPLEKIRNGFEVNEKNGKENLEIKEFKKL